MKTTRKQFVTTVATGLAAAALNPSRLLGAATGADAPDAREFKDLVGETFRFRGPDAREPVDVVLAEYVDAPPQAGTVQFTLKLAAPGGENLREGTYSVDHPRTGTFAMFVIPTGRDAKGQTLYRADFNLLLKATGGPAPAPNRR
jgi:hypothetical protein